MEQQGNRKCEHVKSDSNIDKYINGNLLMINSSKEDSLQVAKNISTKMNSKLVVSTAESDIEFAALLYGLADGEIVFVDISDPLFEKNGKDSFGLYYRALYKCFSRKEGRS